MNKFKIGDRVENEVRGLGTVINIRTARERACESDTYLVEYDNKLKFGHSGNVGGIKGKDGHCWWEFDNEIVKAEGENMKDTIVIYRNGQETIALLKQDNKLIKKAVASCCPDDTYDFKVGAEIAYMRLMGAPKGFKKLVGENGDLKESIEEKTCLIKIYMQQVDDYRAIIMDMQNNLDKQKEINKELVDENKKLKAEIEKLKPSNREIQVYDTVEIVNYGNCYDCREGIVRQYAPFVLSKFKGCHAPKNGDIGVIVAKAKIRNEMNYVVIIDGQAYVMGERGIKLHNN